MDSRLIMLMLSTIIVVCKPNVALITIAKRDASFETVNLEALHMVSNGLNRFAANFYKKAANGSAGNLVCSPISAGLVLSMTAHGAVGNTETEMRTILHLPDDRIMGLEGFKSLINSLNAVKNVNLSVANKIFINESLTVKQEFKNVIALYFKSEVQNLNLARQQEASGIVNTWCKEKTNYYIKEIIKPDDLVDAKIVLVNAVYFKGIWKTKFNPTETKEKYFFVDENTFNNVHMMTLLNDFNYGELPELDAVYIELPYASQAKNESTSMFIICPNTIGGLKKAQENIDKVNFKQMHEQETLTKVKLFLPKFKIENTLDLKPILKKMGIRRIFETADFSDISEGQLTVSKIIQKAFVEVNEEGSRATTLTAAIGLTRSAIYLRSEPIVLAVDKPFIYTIYHPSTNTILFQGHVSRLPA